MYYKEEELYNGTERVYLEEYKYSWIGECCRVGLCVNSLIIFCRADNNCTDGHEYLSQTNKASSWLNNLGTLCPKIAWGIAAWLLVYTNTDSKKRLIYGNDTKRGVFSKYKAECVKRYEYANKEDYDYYKANEDEVGIKNLDEAFYAEHINQEREYIRRFTRPECITEEYYQVILECAKEYIKWVEERNEVQEETENKSRVERLPIFHADGLNFALLLSHLKDCSNGKRKIVDKDITAEGFAERILSADLSVFPQKVYKIFFLKQISDHYINDGEKPLWYNEAMRKAGITERDLNQQNESGNTFIQEFRYSKFKVKQVDTTKNNNCR